MARKSNTKVDYSQLSSAMQTNAKQIYDDKRQETQPEAPVKESEVAKAPEPVTEVKTAVRKKTAASKIKRENGVCLYLEDRHKEIVENIIYNNRIKNQQRVLQTALNEFIKKYYADGKLNEAGVKLIREYDESVKA